MFSAVNDGILIALIGIAPSVLWVLLVIGVVATFHRPIRDQLLPRLGGINVLGVEATFIRERMDRAIKRRDQKVSEDDRGRVLRRVCKAAGVVQGAAVVWMDADPRDTVEERAMLRFSGVSLDLARSPEEALALLQEGDHDAVIARAPVAAALALATGMEQRGAGRPLILYAGSAARGVGTPPGAFAVTDRPDELLHYLTDVLERSRI